MSSDSDATTEEEEEVNPKDSLNIRPRIDCTVCLLNISKELATLAETNCAEAEEIIKDKEHQLAFKLAKLCFEGTIRSFGKKASISSDQNVDPTPIVNANTTENANESIPNDEIVTSSQPDPIYDSILTGVQNSRDQVAVSYSQLSPVIPSPEPTRDTAELSDTFDTSPNLPLHQNGIVKRLFSGRRQQ